MLDALSPPARYKPESCWKDVHRALTKAEQVICITGWSVWTKLKLLRGEDASKDDRTLGQILLDKAEQGVQVRSRREREKSVYANVYFLYTLALLFRSSCWSGRTRRTSWARTTTRRGTSSATPVCTAASSPGRSPPES